MVFVFDLLSMIISKSIHVAINGIISFRPVKAMVFPVVMYGCESWTVKKAERRRIDAFELLCCFYQSYKSILPGYPTIIFLPKHVQSNSFVQK